MTSLRDYICGLQEDQIKNFRQEWWYMIQFFDPLSTEIVMDDLNPNPTISWDNNNQSWMVSTFSLKKNYDTLPFLIRNYIEENQEYWDRIISDFEWKDLLGSLYGKAVFFTTRLIEKIASGEDFEKSFENEWNQLIGVRNEEIIRVKKIILQNISLNEKNPIIFPDFKLEINYPNITKKKVIKFSLKLRCLTKDEIIDLNITRYFGTPLRISTCLEILYSIPSVLFFDGFDENINLRKCKFVLRKKIQDTIDYMIDTSLATFKFLSGAIIHTHHLDIKNLNDYLTLMSSSVTTLRRKQFLTYFYTKPFKISTDRYPIITQIQQTMFGLRENNSFLKLSRELYRIDEILSIKLMQTYIMYWSFLEKLFSSIGYFLMAMASWFYQTDSFKERNKEFKFWQTVNFIRNKYIHGTSIQEIEEQIKNTYKNQNLSKLIFTVREKIFRIFIFTTLLIDEYNISSSEKIDKILFKNGKKYLIGDGIFFKFKDFFNDAINKNRENELGKVGKHKTQYVTRLMQI